MNSSQFILDTIHSIASQTYRNIEHIVIDGGSTDGTVEILKANEHLIDLWISEKDAGMYDALRKGFDMCEGEYACWLNADDLFYPWTCGTVASLFQTNQACQWLTGIESHMGSDSVPYVRLPHSFPRQIIEKGYAHGRAWGFIQQESTFFSMQLYRLAGGLDTKYRLAGDFDLWRKMAQHAELYSVLCPLGIFRHHTGQLSGNKRAYYKELERAGGRIAPWLKPLSIAYSQYHYLLAKKRDRIFMGKQP